MSDDKKEYVIVNGKKEKPIRKVKVPLDINWQKIVKEKQESK